MYDCAQFITLSQTFLIKTGLSESFMGWSSFSSTLTDFSNIELIMIINEWRLELSLLVAQNHCGSWNKIDIFNNL